MVWCVTLESWPTSDKQDVHPGYPSNKTKKKNKKHAFQLNRISVEVKIERGPGQEPEIQEGVIFSTNISPRMIEVTCTKKVPTGTKIGLMIDDHDRPFYFQGWVAACREPVHRSRIVGGMHNGYRLEVELTISDENERELVGEYCNYLLDRYFRKAA